MNLDDRLRELNPFPRPTAGAALDDRAEADLVAILSAPDTVRPEGRPGHPERPEEHARSRPRWLVPVAAAAAVAALIAGLGFDALASQRAHEDAVLVATQSLARPLDIDGTEVPDDAMAESAGPATESDSAAADAPGTKTEILGQARAAAESAGDPESPRDLQVTHWELGTMWDASAREITPDLTLPMTYVLSAEPGGMVRQVSTAGRPVDADGRALDPEARNLEYVDLEPGQTITRDYPDEDFAPLFPEEPPASVVGMRDYLIGIRDGNQVVFADGDRGLLQVAGMMLMYWNLDPAANDALLQVLADQRGLTYLGQTTDRDGRPAWAMGRVTEDHGTYRTTLLVDTQTGQVTGYEDAYLTAPPTGEPDFPVPAVLRYIQTHQD